MTDTMNSIRTKSCIAESMWGPAVLARVSLMARATSLVWHLRTLGCGSQSRVIMWVFVEEELKEWEELTSAYRNNQPMIYGAVFARLFRES